VTVARYIVGDALAVLPTLEPASVDTVVSLLITWPRSHDPFAEFVTGEWRSQRSAVDRRTKLTRKAGR
jgi:hypothetical protein